MPLYTPIDTQQEFERRVNLAVGNNGVGTPEDIHLEFKREQHRNPSQQRELARDVAQFANTDGGTLVIGVSEVEDPRTNGEMAEAIHAVKEVALLKAWIDDALTNYLFPAGWRPSMLEFDPWGQGPVLVLNVDPSDTMVAVWNPQRQKQHEGVEYLYRTAKGKEWFTPEEAAM